MFADSLLDLRKHHHSHRGWTTPASLALEALGIGSVLLLPQLHSKGLPQLQWRGIMALPAPPSAPRPGPHRSPTLDRRNVVTSRILAMREIFQAVPNKIETEPPPDGEVFAPGVPGATGGPGGPGTVLSWLGLSNLAPPPTSKPSTSPPRISRMMKGSLIYRVQPSYPALARATRGQGPVVLGTVISRTRTIASLHVVSGHPLLVKSAIEAVEQWRYPGEVITEVTLNFVLAGG